MEENVVIVNRSNQITTVVSRSVMRAQVMLHRASYVVIVNSREEILIQKRSSTKDLYPGYFDPTTGGVVQEKESYEQNAIRELEEELGIKEITLNILMDFHFENELCKVWGRAFWIRYDGKITLVDGEVEDFFFLKPSEVNSFLEQKQVMPDGKVVIEKYLGLGAQSVG